MDGADPASGTPKLEVYGDALVPNTNTRIPKPWERAPVPAHAPRLQGQKIWKKARTRPNNIKEDAAQHELNLAGKGARKRARAGGKENIAEARWMVGGDGLDVKAGEELEDGEAEEVRERGRKRTNLDHVITPRKPLRQTTTNAVVQTQVAMGVEDSAEKPVRRRKSIRKSLHEPLVVEADAFTQAIPGQEAFQHEFALMVVGGTRTTEPVHDDAVSVELPAAAENEVLAEGIPVEEAIHIESALLVEESRNLVVSLLALTSVEESEFAEEPVMAKSEVPTELIAVPVAEHESQPADSTIQDLAGRTALFSEDTDLQSSALAKDSAQTPESQMQESRDDTRLASDAPEQHPISESTNSPTKIPLNDSKTSSGEQTPGITEQPSSFDQDSFDNISPPPSALHNESQPVLMESDEKDQNTEPSRPLKSTGTPKQQRPSSARPGTRRSTRATRASSAKMEEQPVESLIVAEVEAQLTVTGIETVETSTHEENLPVRETPPSPSTNSYESFNLALPAKDDIVKMAQSTVELTLPLDPQDFELGDVTVRKSEYREFEQLPLQEARQGAPEDRFADAEFEPPLVSVSPSKQASTLVDFFQIPQPSLEFTSELGLNHPSDDDVSGSSSPPQFYPAHTEEPPSMSNEQTVEILGVLEPSLSPVDETVTNDSIDETPEDAPIPDSTISDLVATISENAPSNPYDQDDTALLRNFLTRVKADKEAKAQKAAPKRKRSLPHSPLRLSLGDTMNGSPSPPKEMDEFGVTLTLPTGSPSNKRRKRCNATTNDDDTIEQDLTEPKSIRRSGRTRLPVVKSPVAAPSFIPVRRLGQDGDTTVTLKCSEEKELAALTRVNTRKNKGAALSVPELLKKKGEEKEDPAYRQRLLKEVFDEKAQKDKKGSVKNVEWAAEIAQFQEAVVPNSKKMRLEAEKEQAVEKDKKVDEEKKSTVRVGSRSKIALGMGMNGTPAPKRRTRERA